MKYILTVFGLALILLVTRSCDKQEDCCDVIPPPEDTLARFYFTASDSFCSVIQTSGSYIVGGALSTQEFISLEADVEKAGNWTYSTDTLNGYYFTASGQFTDTGKQMITLYGKGTPERPGNNIFTLKPSLYTLHHGISVLDGELTLEPVPDHIYFKGTIGGEEYYVNYAPNNPDRVSFTFGNGDSAHFNSFVYLSPSVDPAPPGTGSLTIQKQFLAHFNTSAESDFKEFLKPGAYPFVVNKCYDEYRTSGIMIFWDRDDGIYWQTIGHLNDQTGSSFKIVGVEEGHTTAGLYYIKTLSRFNCKLYSYPTGQVKELINGEAVSYWIRKLP